jgi:tetratricopeptide (TPR) repeat protein
LTEAEASLGEAMRLNGNDAIAHQANALIMVARHNYAEALTAATRSIELEDTPYSHGLRGSILEQLERFEEALTEYRAVVAAEPTHAVALARIARLLAHVGRSADAIVAMEAALQADPENYVLAGDLGNLLVKTGQPDRANAAFAEALRKLDALAARFGGAGSDEFAATRTLLLSLMGRHADALRVADAALRAQFDNVRMLSARCLARVMEGTQVATGLRDCETALRYEPGTDKATGARALARLRLGQWQGAIADFDEMLTWDAEDARALYGRGLARIGSGDRARGENDLAAAKRIDLFAYEAFEQMGFRNERPATAQAAARPAR